MAGLLYYLPGRKHCQLPEMAGLGLGYAFERDCTPCQVLDHGPDGGAGVVCADATRINTIGHYADRQQWQKIPNHPAGAWVGRYSDEPVTPEHLQRIETLPGHYVRLCDGRDWIVPVARGIAQRDGLVGGWYVALPQKIAQDEEGKWSEGQVVDRYAPLWDLACRWWDQIVPSAGNNARGDEDREDGSGVSGQGSGVGGQESVAFDFAGLHDAAVEVLAANYRLSGAEASLLGLFEDGTARAILMALIDWPTIERLTAQMAAAEKKTDDPLPAAG